MAEIQLKLAGYCPSCGAETTFTSIGDQEMDDGRPPIALGNCDHCGSTVALAAVEDVARACWPRQTNGCQPCSATLRRTFGEYSCELTIAAEDLHALASRIAAATLVLAGLSVGT